MAKGSVGVNTGTIIQRKRKPRPCDCSKCKNVRIFDGQMVCMYSGDFLKKSKTSCANYRGPYVYAAKKKKKSYKYKRNRKR